MAGPKGAPRPEGVSGGGGTSGPSTGATYGPGGARAPIHWTDDDLRRRTRIVAKLYPGLKKRPKILMSLASQDIPDDHLIESVTKTAGFETIQRQAKQLKKASQDDQRAAWDAMDKTTRTLLKQADYRPPEEEHPGIFEQVVDTVTDLPGVRIVKDLVKGNIGDALEDTPFVGGIAAAVHGKGPMEVVGRLTGFGQMLESGADVGGGITDLTGQAVGNSLREAGLGEVAGAAHTVSSGAEEYVAAPLMDAMNTVSAFPKQLYRLGTELDKQKDWFSAPIPEPEKIFSAPDEAVPGLLGGSAAAAKGLVIGDDKPVKHFIDAWEKTAVGERYFPDRAVYAAGEFVDDDPYMLETAKQIAGGSSLEDIAKKYGEPNSQAYIDEYLHLSGLQSTDAFQKAVHALENGKVSIGRDLVRTLGVNLDSEPGQLLSGATDAVVTWYTDPLLIAGKIRHVYKAKEAIQTAEGMEAAWDVDRSAVQNVHGLDWESKYRNGEISAAQINKLAPRQATAADMATAIMDSRGGKTTALYDFFDARFPRFQKALTGLIDHDNELAYQNRERMAEELGRKLTAEEAARVPGISSSEDIWTYYNSQEGRMRFASGRLAGGEVGNFYLPALTRSQRVTGAMRAAMTQSITSLAERGLGSGAGKQEALIGLAGMERAAAEAPEKAEGMIRLYRVEGGSGMLSNTKYGREAEQMHWFDNIEQARASGLGLGKFGQFGYIDVTPDDIAKATNITDEALMREGINDYLMHPGFEAKPTPLGPVGEWAEIGGEVKPVLGGMMAMPARLAQSLMARVPTGTMNLWGPDMPTQLSRLLDMEYGGAVKGELFDAIIKAESPVVRREMVRSVIDRIGYANGVYIDDAGRTAMDRYLKGVDQSYALDGKDLVSTGTVRTAMGIAPFGDHADQFQLPDWKEVGRQAKRMGVMNTMLGPSQAPMWDAFIGKAWKPAMLFRLGFAPRAAAEEAIVTLLRAPQTYTEGALLRMAKAGDEPVVVYRDIARRAKGMSIYMPGNVASEEFMDPLEKLAHYLPNWSKRAMRGVAVSQLDPQTLHGARILADNPEVLSSVANAMTRVGSYRTNWSLAEDVMGGVVEHPHYTIRMSPQADGRTVEIKSAGSEFMTYGMEDPDRPGIFFHQADRWVNDGAQREVMRARNLLVDNTQADTLAAQLTSRGMRGESSHDVVRQAINSMQADAEFSSTYRKYINAKRDADQVDKAEELHGRLHEIALGSGDANLVAIADAAYELPRFTESTLLIDHRPVLAQLRRPEPEISALDRQLSGPHLLDDEQGVYDHVLGQLPEVEAGKTRVFGRAGARGEEKAAQAAVRRQFPELPEEELPWKYVTTDPNEVIARVMDDVKSAKAGRAGHTENLVYADVPNHELIEENGQTFLQRRHQAATTSFGTDLGTQLRDISNWSQEVDGNQARRWAELADRAMAGDSSAASELGRAVAERQLQNPKALRNVREMGRGAITAEGIPVAQPLRDGMTYVYYPTIKPADADAAFLAIDPASSTGRRYLNLRTDMKPGNAAMYDSLGEGPQYAHSRYASADPDEVRSFINEITDRAAEQGQTLNIGMARLELPETRTQGYFRDNKGSVGTHDYEMNFGESLNGTPIDLNGPLVEFPGARRAMTVDEFVAAHGPGTEAEYERLAQADELPQVEGPKQLTPGTEFENAVKSHADIINQTFDDLFTESGRVKHDITVDGAHYGEMDALSVFTGTIPEKVVGPVRYIPPDPWIGSTIARVGFDATVTPLVNAVSRTPLYVNNALRRVALSEEMLRPIMSNPDLVEGAAHLAETLKLSGVDELYSKMRTLPSSRLAAERLVDEGKLSSKWLKLSDDEWDLAHSYFKNEQITRQQIGSAASEGALADTIPFIDDHHVRSQFAEDTRNLIPFWWAQEAFFRRWAGTIAHSPEAIRKAQLIMQGARHAGIVYKSDEGEDTFLIPGSSVVMSAIMKPVQLLFGDKFKLPIPVGIEGQVRMATPGFDAVGVPGFGPLVGIPLATARRVFPEVGALEKGLLGERGAGRNPLEQLFPSFATHIVQGLFADTSTNTHDPQIASASIQAMQYLEANGHGLPDNATPRERQQYIDRVTHWARSMVVARAIFGFIDPAPTQLKIGEPEVAGEFQKLVQNVGLEEAMSEMVRLHPDATSADMFSKHHDVRAYATAGTKALAGAPLPQTAAAEAFMDNNKDFIEKFPLASSWMLPQSHETDENVRSVRALQLELGLRARKTPEEWYGDFKFNAAADVYFKSSDEFQKAREKLKSSKDRGAFDAQWKDWKTKYLAQHPMFADTINDQTGVKRRAAVIEEVQRAFQDPDLPDFAHKKALVDLVESYTSFRTALSRFTGQRGTKITEARKQLNTEFASWAKTYVAVHPMTKAFYQRNIFPDIDLPPSKAEKFDTELHANAKNAVGAQSPMSAGKSSILSGPAPQTTTPFPVVGGRGRGAVTRGNASGGYIDDEGKYTPPGGYLDGQRPWTANLPPAMAQGGGDGRHPVPQVPVSGGAVKPTPGKRTNARDFTPQMSAYQRELQQRYPTHDVTAKYDEKKKGWYLYTPRGRVRADAKSA